MKFTWFKCGGLCVGLSWSHVLGDAFSAFNFITKWSHALAGHVPPKSLHVNPNYEELQSLPINSIQDSQIPIVKRATILDEERWIAATDTKIVTHTFYVSYNQLQDSVTSSQESNNTCCFEIVSALVWKCLAQIRSYSEPKDVVICEYHSENYEFPTNIGLEFSTVEASSKVSVSESDVLELARLIGSEKKKVEKHVMEKLVEESEGKEDFIVYGTRLTFVNLEEEGNVIYGVKLKGEKPMVANCALHGVGDEGVVLVLPAPQDKEDGGKIGRLVTVSLPEKEVEQLKDKLGSEWGIASHP